MIFLEICQQVLEIVDRDASELQEVMLGPDMDDQHRKIVLAVQGEYARVQRLSRYWNFHHNTGAFLLTEADTEDYSTLADGTTSVNTVKDVFKDSFKIRRQGSTGWSRLAFIEYEDWRNRCYLVNGFTGMPVWITRLPSRAFRLTGVPNAVYEINAEWTRTNHALRKKDDEPLWDEDYHELLVWLAIRRYMRDYDVSAEMEGLVNENLPILMQAFYREYLPEMIGPGTFF